MYRIIEKQNSAGTCYEMQTYDGQNSLVDTKLIQVNSYATTSDDGTDMIQSNILNYTQNHALFQDWMYVTEAC